MCEYIKEKQEVWFLYTNKFCPLSCNLVYSACLTEATCLTAMGSPVHRLLSFLSLTLYNYFEQKPDRGIFVPNQVTPTNVTSYYLYRETLTQGQIL